MSLANREQGSESESRGGFFLSGHILFFSWSHLSAKYLGISCRLFHPTIIEIFCFRFGHNTLSFSGFLPLSSKKGFAPGVPVWPGQ